MHRFAAEGRMSKSEISDLASRLFQSVLFNGRRKEL